MDSLDLVCYHLDLLPVYERGQKRKEGIYSVQGLDAEVDLSEFANGNASFDAVLILKSAVKQLATEVHERHHLALERRERD